MTQEQAFTHWMMRFTQWSIAAVDPQNHSSEFAKRMLEGPESLVLAAAKTNVDMLLQAGFAPHEVAIALAHAAALTVAEMINHYEPPTG